MQNAKCKMLNLDGNDILYFYKNMMSNNHLDKLWM